MDMPLFFETIQINNGIWQNLEYHQARLDRTRVANNINHNFISLNSLGLPDEYKQGMIKCRLLYNTKIQDIEFIRYKRKKIESLQIVCDDNIQYDYKAADRASVDSLFTKREQADDVLIVRSGLITDTSFCNIAFFNGTEYHTPKHPLLAGTQRALLLDKGIIKEKHISINDIKYYKTICLFNAMIDWASRIEFSVEAIGGR